MSSSIRKILPKQNRTSVKRTSLKVGLAPLPIDSVVKTEWEVFNYTGHRIVVLDHNGLRYTHNPNSTTPPNKEFIGSVVIIRKSVVSNSTMVSSNTGYALNEPELLSEDDIPFKVSEATKLNERSHTGANRSHSSEGVCIVSYYTLYEIGGSLYLKDSDIVIATEQHANNIIHPNSKEALNMYIEDLYDSAHTYSIEMNECRWDGQPYYINLNGSVQEIIPTQSPSKGDYVQIIFKKPHEPAVILLHCGVSDKELSENGIFKNYREADAYGKKYELELARLESDAKLNKAKLDVNNVIAKAQYEEQSNAAKILELNQKLELLERQQQVDLKKAEVDESKALRTHELAVKAHQIDESKYEKDVLKLRQEIESLRESHAKELEHMRYKEMYERRSFERKDTSEVVKFLPTMIAAGIAAFAILK